MDRGSLRNLPRRDYAEIPVANDRAIGGGDQDGPAPGGGENGGPGSLTPGQATRGTLQYAGNKQHYYLFRSATRRLDEETLFDCTSDNFYQFMKNLGERADEFGWSTRGGILHVPKADGTMVNLLTEYGSITLEEIEIHERSYWNNGYRKSQDDRMLYECIMKSLSTLGKAKVNIHSSDYKLMSGQYNRYPSGLCLLKVVVRESYLDSNATTGMLRQRLATLDLYLPTVNNDIIKFNMHVKMLLEGLQARGEQTLDLLTNLFRGYMVCSDKEFVKYITDLETDHDMENRPITAAKLMKLAEKKYKIMVSLEKWEAPTQVDEQIMALQAKISDMKQKLETKKKRKKDDDDRKPAPRKKNQKQERPDWFNHAPPHDKINETKHWNKIDWHWCCEATGGHCGGVWRAHKPKDCKPFKKKNKFDPKKRSSGGAAPKIELKTAVDEEYLAGLTGGYESDVYSTSE
ncbi:unnamed protein product [Cylindrotheca closterium]|uniref:Uncharacterized protein n=1 Tax=Cylindrotheca closterium TaxID=2856 RepID=A0AAD2FQZ3_9STRA|nr:unnamed protein product [Cylindrotheca closterium]